MNHAVIPFGEHFVSLAVTRSLGKKNIKTTVVSEDKNAMTFFSKYCHEKKLVDNPISPYSGFSKNQIIMPIGEDLIIELAKNLHKYQFTPAFPGYSVLELAFNKRKLIDRAMELNVPCPETIFIDDFATFEEKSGKLKFPVVFKPVRSRGGLGISFIDSGDQIKDIFNDSFKKFGPLLIQEKIPYKERYSVAILMNNEQVMKRCCVLHAKRFHPLSNGPASFVETVNKPSLVELGNTLLQSIGYSGIAEIEFVIDSRTNEPKLMEINPRFWGSLQGAISAGVDFPYLLYQMILEGDIEKNLDYKKGFKTRNVIRYEYRRLHGIIRGSYPNKFKIDSVLEFLKFYQDDAYFIFDIHDMKPFFSLFIDTLDRKLKKIQKNERVA
jgi:predicted ATP-grasp superfamily ATP-dependent carboligase